MKRIMVEILGHDRAAPEQEIIERDANAPHLEMNGQHLAGFGHESQR